jgi:hypothetical protein
MPNKYKIPLFIVLISLIGEFMWMLNVIKDQSIFNISILLLHTFATIFNTKTMFSRFKEIH